MKTCIKFLILLIFIFSLFSTSCGYKSYHENFPNGDVLDMEKLNNDTEIILDALKNKDKKKIKGIFSEVASKECENLDESIDKLFNFIEGNIEIYKYDNSPPSDRKSRGFKNQTQYRRTCDIYTDTYHYEMLLVYYTEDDFNPKNVGLYHLKFLKNGTKCGSWQEDLCPGILVIE